MDFVSLGDMARHFQLRRQNSQLDQTLGRLTAEMTSGRKADLATAVSGDFMNLAAIDRRLTTLAAFRSANAEASHFTGSLQRALETTQVVAVEAATALVQAGTNGGATYVDTTAGDVRQKLHVAVTALNARVGDRYLLSGAATDRKPVAGGTEILDALKIATAGQVTVTGFVGALEAWFDAPAGGGGYVDTVYGGSFAPLAGFAIGEGETLSLGLDASDATLRDVLKGLSLGALVAEGAMPNDLPGRAGLLREAGEMLLASNSDIAALQARVGTVEARISGTDTRNAAEAGALQLARNGIVAADPFETATALEGVQTQIEALYSLTARLSRLSLADYLR